MSFFKKLRNKINYYLKHSRNKRPSDKKDEENYDVGIKFVMQLANGSLVFEIIDDDFEYLGGYVIVSQGIPKIVKNNFGDFEDECDEQVCDFLKQKALEFYLSMQ